MTYMKCVAVLALRSEYRDLLSSCAGLAADVPIDTAPVSVAQRDVNSDETGHSGPARPNMSATIGPTTVLVVEAVDALCQVVEDGVAYDRPASRCRTAREGGEALHVARSKPAYWLRPLTRRPWLAGEFWLCIGPTQLGPHPELEIGGPGLDAYDGIVSGSGILWAQLLGEDGWMAFQITGWTGTLGPP